MNRSLAASLALAAFLSTATSADEWPHWRGPLHNGVSVEAEVATRWSPTENVVWKLPLPETSGSTPIVWQDHVFLQVADGKQLMLWAISRLDGEVLWKRPLDDRNVDTRKGNLSSPSPVTDGDTIWVMTGTGVLTAFDLAGGQLWQRDLQGEYGEFGINHGYASSPLLDGGVLFVQVLHGYLTDDPSYVLAVDGNSGRNLWRVERPTDAPAEAPDAYTTPAMWELAGERVLVISGGDYVTGHDPATGEEIWRVGGLNPTRNPMQRIVASPIVSGDRLIVPSRVRPLLALVAEGGVTRKPRVVWEMDRGPDVPTPVIDGQYVYLLTDKGIVWCLDLPSGDVVWGPERIQPAIYSASPVIAGGNLYATSEEGLTTVLKTGPQFEILAENAIDEYTLASLAVAHGQIFLRTAEHLYCIESRGAEALLPRDGSGLDLDAGPGSQYLVSAGSLGSIKGLIGGTQ